jgi:lantibiotic modifying enzyme
MRPARPTHSLSQSVSQSLSVWVQKSTGQTSGLSGVILLLLDYYRTRFDSGMLQAFSQPHI